MVRIIAARFVCLLLPALLCACEQEAAPRSEGVPNNAFKKSDLAGEWISSNTAVAVPMNTGWTFEGATDFGQSSKLRWEVQEDVLVGYQSFETVQGLDTNVDAEPPKTGYVPPGTRCFEAPSGKELPCIPNSETGERGHAGEPNVVCRDPQDAEIDCFPYRGEVFAIYEIKRHFDQRVEDGRVVVDESAPWHERAFVEVDWSKSLFESPFFGGGFRVFAFLDQATVVGVVEAGEGHRDALTTRRTADGSLDYFDFVNRLHVEPPYEIVGEGVDAFKEYLCDYGRPCSAAEIAVRVAYRRADPATEFEPRSYGRDEQSRFPLFRSERVGYDPYIGAAVSERVALANQLPLWKAVYQRDADGAIVRDDAGAPIGIPHAEREVEPVVFYLTGEWPDALIDEVGASLDGYDTVLREAVVFLRGTDLESEPTGIVRLHFNGRVKRVALAGSEATCNALIERGAARLGTLSTGTAACEITGYVPGVAPGYFGADVDAEWSFDSDGEVAVLGDLLHHKIHWAAEPQGAGPLGYGPAVTDPETAMVLSGMAAVYGHSLNLYTTSTLDTINLLNGRVTLQDLAAGDPSPTFQAKAGSDFKTVDSGDFLKNLMKQHGHREASTLREILVPGFAAPTQSGTSSGMTTVQTVMETSPAADALFSYDLDQESAFSASREALAAEARYHSIALANNVSLAEFYEESATQFAGRFADRPIEDLAEGGPVWHELRRHILADVLTHEVGHVFGLRHNFKGSHDATNYDDEYWELRKETLRPASEVTTIGDVLTHHVRSEAQVAGGMDLHAGSSVMDYNHVAQSIGVGRYDRAALLSSYAGAAEVFDVAPNTIPAAVRSQLAEQAISEAVTAPTFLERNHYSQLPYLLGSTVDEGLENLRARKLVPWKELRAALLESPLDAAVPVPYEQCSDELRLGTARHCSLFDSGADDLERALDITSRLELDGMLRKFSRGRDVTLSPVREYARLMDRYLLPLRSLYQHGVNDWYAGLPFETLEGGSWILGSSVGFNQFVRMLATPEYGEYHAPEREGDWCTHTSDTLGGQSVVPMGTGRRLDGRYEPAGAYNEPTYVELGDRYARRAALVAMTMDADPIGLLEGDDLGIGYQEVYSYYIDRALTDLFLEDYALIGPRLQASGATVYPSFVDLRNLETYVGTPPEGCILELPMDDRERQLTVLLGSLLLTETQSLVFHHRARVFRMGTAEEPVVPSGLSITSFSDPETGIEYGALVTLGADLTIHEPGLAARLVSRGAELRWRLIWMDEEDPERPSVEAAFARTVKDAEFLRSTFNLVDSVTLGAP